MVVNLPTQNLLEYIQLSIDIMEDNCQMLQSH